VESQQRNMILAVLLSALVLFGWSALSSYWFPTANPPVTKIEEGQTKAVIPAGTPTRTVKRDRAELVAASPRVAIRNAKVVGSINLTGARIDDLTLPEHRETIAKDSPPIRLLSPEGAAKAYFASFGWSGEGVAVPGPDTVWTADRRELTPTTPVTLSWPNGQGQVFRIKIAIDDGYLFTVEQQVANTGAGAVAVRPYGLVSREGRSPDRDEWVAHVGPLGVFNAAANYDVDWDDLDEAGAAGTRFQSRGGWLGFGDKYWLTALAPGKDAAIDAGFRSAAGSYQADYALQPAIVAPGKAISVTSRLFAGAKEVALLDDYEDRYGIDKFGRAIDWGWFEVFEKPIFYYLDWVFKQVGNFGLAIIILTFTVRLIMFPIAQKQFASMAGMRVVQPKMKAIQERYKDDKPRQQQEIMALYKSEKINPVAGCLPILLQIPIFFALYKVLVLTIEMRHQPFVAWLHDLSAPDPMTPINLFGLLDFTPPAMIAIGVLPIILGITMWMQFKLNPAPTDPIQAQMFAIMPWVMMVIMAPFAAGLQLYWATSNILTIAQQKWLYSKHPQMKAVVAS